MFVVLSWIVVLMIDSASLLFLRRRSSRWFHSFLIHKTYTRKTATYDTLDNGRSAFIQTSSSKAAVGVLGLVVSLTVGLTSDAA